MLINPKSSLLIVNCIVWHCKFEQYIASTSNLVKPIAMVLQAENNWHLTEKICEDYSFINSREVSITFFLTTL